MSINVFQSQPKGYVIFTSSQNWTVPAGVHHIRVLAIGGGGGGGGGYSSTYVGGGGGSGAVSYGEFLVQPGTQLLINIGAGGAPGTGGASPTAGGAGGQTNIQVPSSISGGSFLIAANGGGGGGAASSTANGSPGGGGAIAYQMVNMEGIASIFMIAFYGLNGNASGGQTDGMPPIFLPSLTGAANANYGFPGLGTASAYGAGGSGGGVNANGYPGYQGILLIWWGDE